MDDAWLNTELGDNVSFIKRRNTKKIKIGNMHIGGDSPISIQSMTNTDTRDVKATVAQIHRLQEAGCEIVRVAVVNRDAALCLGQIKKRIDIPLVADIHFDYKLAVEAVHQGVDKLRINPGNIEDKSKVKEIVHAAKDAGIPIRVGVNSGSLAKSVYGKYGGVCADALVESVMQEVSYLESLNFYDMILAVKSSNAIMSLDAYEKLAKLVDYPFHIGITEAGTKFSGTIKSSVAMGSMLLHGIGDTMRVSLTADPVEEVKVAKEILSSLDIRRFGATLISCPTCGRCEVDLEHMANSVQTELQHVKKPITVAVMGCAVNGPGEAKEADIGIASGRGAATIFKHGNPNRRVDEDDAVDALMDEISKM